MSGPDDTVRRGPERWMRAALNAAKRPNSPGAKLYHARVRNASLVRDGLLESGKTDTAYEFTVPVSVHTPTGSFAGYAARREHATCSIFCTVMQIQLQHGTTDLAEIDLVFKGTPSACYLGARKVRPLVGKHRKMRCHVCASEIKAV